MATATMHVCIRQCYPWRRNASQPARDRPEHEQLGDAHEVVNPSLAPKSSRDQIEAAGVTSRSARQDAPGAGPLAAGIDGGDDAARPALLQFSGKAIPTEPAAAITGQSQKRKKTPRDGDAASTGKKPGKNASPRKKTRSGPKTRRETDCVVDDAFDVLMCPSSSSAIRDLSVKSNLETFRQKLAAHDKTVLVTLMLRHGGSVMGPCNLALTKDQVKQLKAKFGLDALRVKLDPDGQVFGACFMLPDDDAEDILLYFLPLLEDGADSPVTFNGEVSLQERETFFDGMLRSKQVMQCFDLQGILRRIRRRNNNSSTDGGIAIPVDSRVICLKLLVWMLEPGLVHDKLVDKFNFESVCDVYGIELDGGGDAKRSRALVSVFEDVYRELELTRLLGLKVCDALRNAHFAYLLQVEVQVAGLLADMESTGICFDLGGLRKHEDFVKQRIDALDQAAYACAGETFNIRSHPQLKRILYEKMGAKAVTPSQSTDEQTLQSLRRNSQQGDRASGNSSGAVSTLASIVLEHRRLSQIVSKWIDADWLRREIALDAQNKGRGRDRDLLRIRCSWNQTATATGRLSASSPNLQAVTKYVVNSLPPGGEKEGQSLRSDGGPEEMHINIRNSFVAEKGSILLSVDYSQIEVRILAHMSNDERLCNMLNATSTEKTDVFVKIANTWLKDAKVLSPPDRPDQGRGLREQAKRVAYSIIYGTSARGLGKQLNISVESAEELKKSFLSFFSGIRGFAESVKTSARQKGFVETMLKRRRFLPSISSPDRSERESAERKAVNTAVQGSAADLIKCAMVRWSSWYQDQRNHRCEARLIAQIHDELLFEVKEESIYKIGAIVKHMMTTVFQLKVPIEVNMNAGKEWGTLSKLDLV